MIQSQEKKLPKHHYIPVFYLKHWTNGDGMLCEFSRKYRKVKPRRTSPDGTGYVRGLYRLPNVPDDKAEIIETKYMKAVDNAAAPVLEVMLSGGLRDVTDLMRVAWARFLHCLVLRSPEYLHAFEKILVRHANESLNGYSEDYAKHRTENDPESFDEFKERFIANPLNTSAARIINRIIDSENVIGHMCSMQWNVVEFSNTNNLLLTSDRPVIMTNGMSRPGAHLAIPISPKKLFIAFRDQQGYDAVRAVPAKELIKTSNTRVAEQARQFVYGFSDADLSFVSRRLGRCVPATPLETGVLRLAAA